MAFYVPSGVAEATQALSALTSSMAQQKQGNVNAAMAQLAALQQSGANAQQMAAPLQALAAGGNPLAMLFGGNQAQNMDVQSAFGGDTTRREFGGEKALSDMDKLTAAKDREQLLFEYKKQRDEISKWKPQVQPQATDEVIPGESDADRMIRLSAAAKTDPKVQAADQNIPVGILKGETREQALERINSIIADESMGLKQDLTEVKNQGIAKLTDKQIQNVTDADIGYDQSVSSITSGAYNKDTNKSWGAEAIRKNRDDLLAKKDEFIANENARLQEEQKIGGPMAGDETYMRAKAQKDFKVMYDKALQTGNINELRKVYSDYQTTNKNIDARYNKKGFYNPFEKEFGSLLRTQKGGRSYGVPSGGDYNQVSVFNPDKGTFETITLGAKSKEDAIIKLKAMDRYKSVDLTGDQIFPADNKGKFQGPVYTNWAKASREEFKKTSYEKNEGYKGIAKMVNPVTGRLTGIDEDKLRENAGTFGIKNVDKLVSVLNNSDANARFMKMSPQQIVSTLKKLDTASDNGALNVAYAEFLTGKEIVAGTKRKVTDKKNDLINKRF